MDCPPAWCMASSTGSGRYLSDRPRIQTSFCLPYRVSIPDGSVTPFGIFSLYGAGHKISRPPDRRCGGCRERFYTTNTHKYNLCVQYDLLPFFLLVSQTIAAASLSGFPDDRLPPQNLDTYSTARHGALHPILFSAFLPSCALESTGLRMALVLRKRKHVCRDPGAAFVCFRMICTIIGSERLLHNKKILLHFYWIVATINRN